MKQVRVTTKFFVYGIIFLLVFSNSAFPDTEERFEKLRNGYKQAMGQVENEFSLKHSELDQSCITMLKTKADEFRAAGNLGFYLEINRYVELIEKGEFETITLDKFQNEYVKDFHRKFQMAQANLAKEERAKAFHMKSVMSSHLTSLVSETTRAGNIDLASLIQDELNRIENDDLYLLALKEAQQDRVQQQARERARPLVALPTPPDSAPAVYGKPMLEVDVSKKVLPQLAENGDYDDQRQNIRLVVSIRSREMVRDYEKLVVKVWAFGRSVINKSKYKMLVTETMKVGGLKRGYTIEVETETFENVYDDHYTAQYGHKFNGYLLIIEDKAGVELFRKASPSNKKGKLEFIRKLSSNEEFKL